MSNATTRAWRTRFGLTPRIYLFTVASFVLVVASLIFLLKLAGERKTGDAWGEWMVAAVTAGDDVSVWQTRLRTTPEKSPLTVALYRPGGELIAVTNGADPEPPLSSDEESNLKEGPTEFPGALRSIGVFRDGKLVAYALLSRGTPPPADLAIALSVVLGVLVLTSVIFARHLVRPIRRLADAATSLGKGDLSTRVRMKRNDELGALAQAFDVMAERTATLVRSQRELLISVSHELRSPIACIHVALDIAKEGNVDQVQKPLAEITSDLAELERLIDDVLAAARLDSGAPGAFPLHNEELELISLCHRAEDRFRSAHPRHELVSQLPSALTTLMRGDPVLLRRAIDNLLENAAKYSDEGTRVELRVAEAPHGFAVEVIDNGIGIDAADLPLVGTPFFRADRSRARTTGGVGLGVALAKRVAEAHGGNLTITSVVGSGTRVRLNVSRG